MRFDGAVAEGAPHMTSIDRRSFISLSSIAAIAMAKPLAAVAHPAIGGTFVDIQVDIRDGQAGVASAFGRAVRAQSRGSAAVEFTENAAGAWIGSAQRLVDLDPAFAYFAGLPGVTALPRAAFLNWMAEDGQKLLDDLSRRYGLRAFVIAHTTRPGIWSRSAVKHSDLFYGRRVAARGLAREVARGLGANVVDSLSEDAKFDIVDGGPPYNFEHGAHQSWSLVSSDSLTPHGEAIVAVISEAAWDRIDDASRRAIAAAALATASIRTPCTATVGSAAHCSLGANFTAAANCVGTAVIADVATRNSTSRLIDKSYSRARAEVISCY